MPRRIVIVGAGLAGSRCAQTLRAEGFDGSITLVGEEPHPPYERPALSKEFLAGTREELLLQAPTAWAELEIDLLLGIRVERIDTKRRLASTARGDLGWDALVLATGARARRPAAFGGSGVHVLRTLADARRLRAELVPGRRLAIVGAGFVGTEVASTAVELGVDVTIVDLASLPFERTLGPEVGRLLANRYRAHGVDLRLEAGVERSSAGAMERSAGSASRTAPSSSATSFSSPWAPSPPESSCAEPRPDRDGRRRPHAAPDVYACGDVAAPWSAEHSRHVRLEHWTSAAGQAAAVARAILGREPAASPTPYFWSDQFGLRLQHVGSAEGWERIVLDGHETSLAARYLAQDGRLVAALLVNRPQQVGALRRELAPELLAA